MLISLHIPKTAGTAWRLFVEANNAGQASFTSDLPRDADSPAMTALAAMRTGEQKLAHDTLINAGMGLVHGHEASELLPALPDAGLIAWLRDPIDRIESEFRHRMSRPAEGELDTALQAGEIPKIEFLRHFVGLYSGINRQAETRNAPHAFFICELQTPALAAIRQTLHWRGSLPKRNVTPREHKTAQLGLSETERAEARRILQDEYALYNQWCADWREGRAADRAREALLCAPPARPPAPGQAWRRRLGVQIERLGRVFGRDWR